MADALGFAALRVLAAFDSEPGRVLNVYFALTFSLITMSGSWALRRWGCGAGVALAGGLIFAALPYHFYRGERHVFLSAYYAVPLAAVWLADAARRGGLRRIPGEPLRPWQQLLIAGAVGSTGVYYAFFACGLFAGLGCYLAARRGSIRAAGPAAVAILLVSLVVAANTLPSIAYRAEHGPNGDVAARRGHEAEGYGLHAATVILPQPDHRWKAFRRIADDYYMGRRPPGEGGGTSLGLAGAAGLLVLAWAGLRRDRCPCGELLGLFAGLTGAVFCFSAVGGIGVLFNLFCSPQIRCHERAVVYVGFFALAATALTLDRLTAELSARRRIAIVLGFAVVALLDSVPKHAAPKHDANAEHFRTNREFVASIAAELPAGAKVLQLPFIPFPEGGPRHRSGDCDHLRLYAHDRAGLAWSHGAVRGRHGSGLLAELAARPPEQLLAGAVRFGFAGLVVDRHAFAPEELGFVDEIGCLLRQLPRSSADGRYAFYSLAGPRADPAESQLAVTGVDASCHGFRNEEAQGGRSWRWAVERKVAIVLEHRRPGPVRVRLTAALHAPPGVPTELDLGWTDGGERVALPVGRGVEVAREIVLPPGRTRIELSSRGGYHAEGIYRLWFRVENLRVEELDAATPTPVALPRFSGE